MHEVNLFGVYFAPVVADLARAAILFFILRWLLGKSSILARVWHAALFEFCLFLGVLTATVYLL